ncbi:MAG: hypothetical protein ACKO5K_08510, partial [Armatimonadota bacterium]
GGGFRVAAWREITDPTGVVSKESLGWDYYRPPAPAKPTSKPKPKPAKPATPKPMGQGGGASTVPLKPGAVPPAPAGAGRS